MKWSTFGLVAALIVPPAAPAVAQQQADVQRAGNYSGVVAGGWTQYDEAAGLKDSGYAGVEFLYAVNEFISIGPYMATSRPTTDGTYFPFVRMEFVDTVFTYVMSQQLTVFDFGLSSALHFPLGPVVLEGLGGIGAYSVRLDPERSNKPVVNGTEVSGFSGMQYQIGGGLRVPVPGGSLRAFVRDVVYTDYERDLLSLSDPLFVKGTAIPHPNPEPPEAKSTIHNLRYELGFNFRLGGGR